ncbi:MAG: hypothetical protein KAS93_02710 [Gammaproteobacteria bacterium]|nr:hypothetical protein [Gammaproteobacteria bacterium]
MKRIIPIALISSGLLITACTTTTTPKAINLQQNRIVVTNVNLNNVAVAQKIANSYCTKYKKISVVTDSKKNRMIFKCVRT